MRPYFFVIFMSSSDVIRIHDMVINRFGGRLGIHDQRLLESAINHPWMIIKYGNDEEHQISNLAAAYFFHIIKNNPFIDGNKRTGLLTTLDFLYQNGFELDDNLDLYQLSLDTAASHLNEKEIAILFKKAIKEIE